MWYGLEEMSISRVVMGCFEIAVNQGQSKRTNELELTFFAHDTHIEALIGVHAAVELEQLVHHVVCQCH